MAGREALPSRGHASQNSHSAQHSIPGASMSAHCQVLLLSTPPLPVLSCSHHAAGMPQDSMMLPAIDCTVGSKRVSTTPSYALSMFVKQLLESSSCVTCPYVQHAVTGCASWQTDRGGDSVAAVHSQHCFIPWGLHAALLSGL